MSIYKQNKQAKQTTRTDRNEAIIGSICGGLVIVVMLGFMVWHWWRLSQWLGLPL